jgi:hypothetical protein
MRRTLAVLNRAPRTWQQGFLLATALAMVASARADVNVEARSTSQAQAGPQPVTSVALVQNGVVAAGGSNVAGPNGSSSAGPIGSGVTSVFADTTQIDGPILATSLATADLAKGNLGVHAEAGGGSGGGGATAIGIPKWTETITFNNTAGSAVELDIFWDTDGSAVDQTGPTIGSIDIQSSILVNIVNDANYKEVHLKGGPAFYMGGCQFIYSALSGSTFGFQPSGNNMFNTWTTTPTGQAGGLIKATLVLPSGVVSITITTLLSIDCRTGAVCDYADGATFSFGALPDGLTWTSESGVFLSATPAGSADTDGDGVADAQDACPGTPVDEAADEQGCSSSQIDAVDNGNGNENENANGAQNENDNGSDNENLNLNDNGQAQSDNDNANSADGNANQNGTDGSAGPATGMLCPSATMMLLALTMLGFGAAATRPMPKG